VQWNQPHSKGQRQSSDRQRRQETVKMDATRLDAVARLFDTGVTRREALRTLFASAATLAAGASLLTVESTVARKKRRKNKRTKKSPPPNVCEGMNWCLDRTQTCGPEGGYGKCLVEAGGGSICAEILFQVASCTECEAPNCTNCRCALAAGGGDRCNNGANGYDFICVREV
jgi:hypothetical protein